MANIDIITQDSDASDRLSQAEDVARGLVDQGIVPGIALAWKMSDGPVRYHNVGALDFGSDRAIDERSIFRIFSQSKPITGIAVMMLIEQGLLGLDQPLADILPAFADMRVLIDEESGATRPAARPITIQHLLTHSAGFGMAGMTLGTLYAQEGIMPGVIGRASVEASPSLPRTLKELGQRLATLPLSADPGERFDYSVAIDILGLVVQTVSGKPFDVFLKDHLFQPLGMVDTGFTIAPENRDRFTALREKAGDQFTLADDPQDSAYRAVDYPAGGGGMLSTAHDYARFAAMLLNGGELDGVRILKPQTVALARSNLLPAEIDHIAVPIGHRLHGAAMGAAMSVQVAPGMATGDMFDWPGAVPAGVFGWPGAAGTACWMDPERRFFLLFLTQYWPSWINGSMRPDIIAAAYRDLEGR